MKKILLVLSICLMGLTGCSDSSNNGGIGGTGGGNVQADTPEAVEKAFFDSYASHVTGAPAEGMSEQAQTNINALIQNLTGKGQMPAAVGIGEVSKAEIAGAIAHIVAGNSVSAQIIEYSNLDVNSNTFMAAVMNVFMSGDTGTNLLSSLKTVNNNSASSIMLADDYQPKLTGLPAEVSNDARGNIVYIFANLPGYLNKVNNTIPATDAVISQISSSLYDLNDATKLYETYDKPNSSFKVMGVLAADGNYGALTSFVANLETIIQNGGETSGGGNEPDKTDFVMMAFPSMFVKLLDGFPGGDVAENPKTNAASFFQAMLDNGTSKPVFDPVPLNREYAPIVGNALKAKGFAYSDFDRDAVTFKPSVTDVFFSDTAAKDSLIKEFNNVAVLSMYLDSYGKLITDAPAEGLSADAARNIKYCLTTVGDMFLPDCVIPAEKTKTDYISTQFAEITPAMKEYATFNKTESEFSMMSVIGQNMADAMEAISNIKTELGCQAPE